MPPLVTTDRPLKHARLVALLDERGADAIQLSRPETLSWYFDGPRTGVPFGGPPVFSAVVHRNGLATVTALENEIDRLAAEEIGGAEFRSVPWFEDPAGSGEPNLLRDVDVAADLRRIRAGLLPAERDRYRALGLDMATAMTRVLRSSHPTMSEHQLASHLLAAVAATGATPSVILVAGESRGYVQHPLPTDAVLGGKAMAVVTGVRFGLHVSITRWVRFRGDETPAERSLRRVEADIFAATVPGRALREVLADIGEAYAAHGFGTADRPAWRAHHQGGPTGYLGRDPKATPRDEALVAHGGAFAWNPWVPYAKIEDTIVVDGAGIEVLTVDPEWPTTLVDELARPVALDLT